MDLASKGMGRGGKLYKGVPLDHMVRQIAVGANSTNHLTRNHITLVLTLPHMLRTTSLTDIETPTISTPISIDHMAFLQGGNRVLRGTEKGSQGTQRSHDFNLPSQNSPDAFRDPRNVRDNHERKRKIRTPRSTQRRSRDGGRKKGEEMKRVGNLH